MEGNAVPLMFRDRQTDTVGLALNPSKKCTHHTAPHSKTIDKLSLFCNESVIPLRYAKHSAPW